MLSYRTLSLRMSWGYTAMLIAGVGWSGSGRLGFESGLGWAGWGAGMDGE